MTSRSCSSSTMPFGSGQAPSGGNVEVGQPMRGAVGVHARTARRGTRRTSTRRSRPRSRPRRPGSPRLDAALHLGQHPLLGVPLVAAHPEPEHPVRRRRRPARSRRGSARPRSTGRRRTVRSSRPGCVRVDARPRSRAVGIGAPTSNQIRRVVRTWKPQPLAADDDARTASAGRCARPDPCTARRPSASRRLPPLVEPRRSARRSRRRARRVRAAARTGPGADRWSRPATARCRAPPGRSRRRAAPAACQVEAVTADQSLAYGAPATMPVARCRRRAGPGPARPRCPGRGTGGRGGRRASGGRRPAAARRPPGAVVEDQTRAARPACAAATRAPSANSTSATSTGSAARNADLVLLAGDRPGRDALVDGRSGTGARRRRGGGSASRGPDSTLDGQGQVHGVGPQQRGRDRPPAVRPTPRCRPGPGSPRSPARAADRRQWPDRRSSPAGAGPPRSVRSTTRTSRASAVRMSHSPPP